METIFMESWLHGRIRKNLREDKAFREWMGAGELPRITREDVDRYHVYEFRKTAEYASVKSSFYRNLLKKADINAAEIKSLKDIGKIPCTDPANIAANPYLFACVPLGDISHVTTFASSGTIGPQKKIFFTDKDLEIMSTFMAVGMRTVAVAGDLVQIMLPSARANDQADLLAQGVRKMGGIAVVTGCGLNAEAQIKHIEESHPAVLFGETAYLWRVTQETQHRHDLKAKGVKTIFMTSEFLSEAMRRQFEAIWGCEVHMHYGMTEMGLGVSIECHAHQGYHYNEADLMVEVIDPESGRALEEGVEGEVVFTAFGREAMPLLRYRTHDLARLLPGPCPCGASSLRRIGPVTRRREAIVKIGTDELYPAAFDEALFAIQDITDYQVTVTEEAGRTVLTFKIETSVNAEGMRQAIEKALEDHPLVKKNKAAGLLALAPVELAPPGALTRMTRAKKLIRDERG
jgi:phenylacetate-CoA ligase